MPRAEMPKDLGRMPTEKLGELMQGFNPAEPLGDPPRTYLSDEKSFYQLIHDPESLVSKTYWATHKMHFFYEVLLEYMAAKEMISQQQYEEALNLHWELQNEREPIGNGPAAHPQVDPEGDPLVKELDIDEPKEDDTDDIDRIYKQQARALAREQAAMDDAINAMGNDFVHESFDGEQGLFLLDEEKTKQISLLFAHQTTADKLFSSDELEKYKIVQATLDVMLSEPSTGLALRVGLVAGSVAWNFIKRDVVPALAAACVLSGKSEDDMKSESFANKLKAVIPKWQVQGEKLDEQCKACEAKLGKAHAQVKTAQENHRPTIKK